MLAKAQNRDPNCPKYFIVDGKVYNLHEWIPKHPGGSIWFFIRTEGRDISMAVHGYHPNSDMVLKILEKYLVPGLKPEDVIDPTYKVPSHLVPIGFNAIDGTVEYDFSDKNSILRQVQSRLDTKEWK